MSHGFEFSSWVVDVANVDCRFSMEGGDGESKSVDLSVTLDVSDAASGWGVKGLVWRNVHISDSNYNDKVT